MGLVDLYFALVTSAMVSCSSGWGTCVTAGLSFSMERTISLAFSRAHQTFFNQYLPLQGMWAEAECLLLNELCSHTGGYRQLTQVRWWRKDWMHLGLTTCYIRRLRRGACFHQRLAQLPGHLTTGKLCMK